LRGRSHHGARGIVYGRRCLTFGPVDRRVRCRVGRRGAGPFPERHFPFPSKEERGRRSRPVPVNFCQIRSRAPTRVGALCRSERTRHAVVTCRHGARCHFGDRPIGLSASQVRAAFVGQGTPCEIRATTLPKTCAAATCGKAERTRRAHV